MKQFIIGLWVVTAIELRQRVRGVAWYVLLGIFAALLLLVSVLLTIAVGAAFGPGSPDNAGAGLYSFIIYFVLLLGSLVAPTLGGNAINGDREAGTLATTQVTLITTPQLVLGKFLAAWLSALAFLAVAVPFLLYSQLFGGSSLGTVVVSLLILTAELGVISAIGVGLSGILRRPLFSIAVTYLIVAALSVGTVIGFGLFGSVIRTPAPQPPASAQFDENCGYDASPDYTVPRFDQVWWMLAANPYVILADAAPTQYAPAGGYPTDLFGTVKLGVRSTQLPPQFDSCDGAGQPTPRDIIDSTVPSWAVGLAIHLLLAVGALWFAIALTHAPSRRLAAGSRVA